MNLWKKIKDLVVSRLNKLGRVQTLESGFKFGWVRLYRHNQEQVDKVMLRRADWATKCLARKKNIHIKRITKSK